MKPPKFSLERRLMLRLTLILAGSFLLFSIVYVFFTENDATFHAAYEVGELSQSMARAIVASPGGGYQFDARLVAKRADWPPGTGFAATDIRTGRPVAGSLPSLLDKLRGRPDALVSSSEVMEIPGGYAVMSLERVACGQSQCRVAVVRPMNGTTIVSIGLSHEFAEEILPCFMPALLLAILVTWITLRSNLRPLRRASSEAASVSVDSPGTRLSTDRLSRELWPLIKAVNRALGRLEEGIAAQRRFTANAAHELRTPLAVLRARADTMPPGELRSALTRDIDRITRAVSHMLLTARLQSHSAGEMAPVGLAALAREVVADIAPLAHANNRDIALEIHDRPVIEGSLTALESALRNLVDNAVRFTPPGSVVTVEVGPGPVLAVQDCGPGVPDAEKSRIFEPFFRARRTRGDGAGLGLAIVSEVAALHGGRVEVVDAASGGARFILSLARIGAVSVVPRNADALTAVQHREVNPLLL